MDKEEVDIENAVERNALADGEGRDDGAGSYEDWPAGNISEPLLLSKSRVNNTSQIAIIGANVCPIESLDYEYDRC